jgi:methyl-accepting chemotaxis protein
MSFVEYLPTFLRKRYARKFAVVALVVILVVSGIALVTQGQVSNRLTDEKLSTVQTNAELEANSFGAWLKGEKKQIRTLSSHRQLQSDDKPEIREGLNTELEDMSSEVVALHYVDQDTETITASTEQELEGQTITRDGPPDQFDLPAGQVYWNPDQPFEFADQDESIVLESFVYKEEGKPSVALASPVPNSNDVVVSVIRTNVRAEQFSSSIDNTRTVAIGGFTTLVLFSEDSEEVLTDYNGDGNTSLEQRILDPEVENTGALKTDDDLVGYAQVPGTDWVIIKEAPKSEALGLQADVNQSLLFLIGSALLGLIGLTAITALGPMRSLRDLADKAQALANGDLSGNVAAEERIDEVGQVRAGFRETKRYLETAAAQTDALAKQEFDDPVLEEEVPGELGASLQGTRTDLEQSINELEAARKETEVARAEAEQLAEYLKEQATEYSEVMQQVRNGDMTQRMESDGREASMDRIATDFNEMIDELEMTIGQLQSYVDEVETAGREVEQSAGTVRTASEQVAESIQEISDDAYSQEDRLRTLSETVDELVSTAEAIRDDAESTDPLADLETVSAEINEIVELSQQMMGEAENVAGAAQEQAAELNGVSERANDLQRYAEPLRDILNRFETDQEHEFVFSAGPTESPSRGPESDD